MNDEGLSEEWIELVEFAMKSGVTKEEFAEFLKKKRERKRYARASLFFLHLRS